MERGIRRSRGLPEEVTVKGILGDEKEPAMR